jgi:pimeloyl-ACP methyl ester carboxylesterase
MPKPIVFIHGLWLHASSWQPWIDFFAEQGYQGIAPGWPGDGATVAESCANPDPIADRGIDEVTDHFASIIAALDDKPIAIGHSFGGLIAQKLLGEDLVAAAVAIDPAQMKGVIPVPFVQIKNALPVLANPANYKRAVLLTPAQFHQGFASVVSEAESNEIYAKYVIPAPGRPLFEDGLANFWPNSPAEVNLNAQRGPLLITGGGEDGTVPESTTRNIHKLYAHAPTVNDYKVWPDRGHSLTVDTGWREIAQYALDWLRQQGF